MCHFADIFWLGPTITAIMKKCKFYQCSILDRHPRRKTNSKVYIWTVKNWNYKINSSDFFFLLGKREYSSTQLGACAFFQTNEYCPYPKIWCCVCRGGANPHEHEHQPPKLTLACHHQRGCIQKDSPYNPGFRRAFTAIHWTFTHTLAASGSTRRTSSIAIKSIKYISAT